MKVELAKPVHKVKFRVCELPGIAISEGRFHGFGSKLCTSVEDDAEVFEEKTGETSDEE